MILLTFRITKGKHHYGKRGRLLCRIKTESTGLHTGQASAAETGDGGKNIQTGCSDVH